ncbi:glutathione S-transferase U17-like [Musa acuminata AAA Group]|uniref:glutathione S-transferase U17-like n=1 Tax=Musa acuminata AAA Group TaxID=214697 RepID=UPI0031E21A13
MVIVEYVDEAWAASGRAIRTTDPYDRALHRFWPAYIDDEVRVAPRRPTLFCLAYLNIALGCFLGWMKAYEKVIGLRFVDEKKTPLLVGCAERFCSHEAVKDLMPKGKVSAANRMELPKNLDEGTKVR